MAIARRVLPSHGARVAMMAHASAESLALSLAVPSIGGVLVQLNWRQTEAALVAMLSGLRCCALIAGRGFAAAERAHLSSSSDGGATSLSSWKSMAVSMSSAGMSMLRARSMSAESQ